MKNDKNKYLNYSLILFAQLFYLINFINIIAQTDIQELALTPVITRVSIIGNKSFTSDILSTLFSTKSSESTLRNGIMLPFYTLSISKYFNNQHDSILKKRMDELSIPPQRLDMKKLKNDLEKLRSFYFDNGFHSSKIYCNLKRDTVKNIVYPSFVINEGETYLLNNILYLGLDSLDTITKNKIENEDKINIIGERFSSALLSQDSGRVVNILRNQGYPFASGNPGILGTVSIFEDTLKNQYLDSAKLFFTTGKRYKFGKLDSNNFIINIGKASKTLNKNFILNKCPFKEGDWFSVSKLSEFEIILRTLPFVSKLNMKNVIDTISNQIFISIDIELTELSGLEGGVSFSLTGTESINDTTFYGFSASANGSYKKMNITGNADQIGFKGSITLNALSNFKQLLLNDYPNLSLGIEYLNSDYSVNFNVGYSSEKSPLNTSNELKNFFGNITFAKGIKFNSYTFFQRALLNFNLNYKEYIDINSYNAIEVKNIFSTLNGIDCVDTNRINGEISKLLIENIYKLQYSQGDDFDYVTNPLVKDNFDALKLKITLNGNLIHDKRNDFFNPTDGNILTLNTELGTVGFKSFWLKLEYDYRWYFPLNANSSIAFRNHAGWIIEPSALKLTPPQSRFFVGGANSCRGWENNNLLATVPPPPKEFDPSIRSCIAPLAQSLLQKSISIFGGIGVFETSFDFRVSRLFKLPETNSFNRQLNNIGLIIFIDAGNAFYRDFQNESLAGTNIFDHIAWSFGGSLTYNTPAGIIRFTPALQVYEPIYPNLNSISNRYFYNRFSDAWTFHLSLGQAF